MRIGGFHCRKRTRILEEYVAYYNYKTRDIGCTLGRPITWEIADMCDNHNFPVPQDFRQLEWKPLPSHAGDMYILSSKQVVRTMNNTSKTFTRIYIQFAMEAKPTGWEGSDQQTKLRECFDTGKFGSWAQPGVRRFLRENSTEFAYRSRLAGQHIKENERPHQRALLGI